MANRLSVTLAWLPLLSPAKAEVTPKSEAFHTWPEEALTCSLVMSIITSDQVPIQNSDIIILGRATRIIMRSYYSNSSNLKEGTVVKTVMLIQTMSTIILIFKTIATPITESRCQIKQS